MEHAWSTLCTHVTHDTVVRSRIMRAKLSTPSLAFGAVPVRADAAPPSSSMSTDVSVVIPTYRRPAPLRDAIQSALAQQGVSMEVIVVDDDPEGSAEAVVRSVGDPRVQFLRCEPATGGNPAIVRNLGWPKAIGRYVHFLDDDDVIVPGAHREMVAALDAAPETGMVFGVIEPFGDDSAALQKERAYFAGAAHRARIAHRFGSRRLRMAFMLFHNTMLVNSACMIRRTCIGPLGGYRPGVLVVEDVDFYSRAMRRFGSVFLNRPVIRYRCGAPSIMSGQKNNAVIARSYAKMYDAYRSEYGALEFNALQLLARLVLRVLFVLTVSSGLIDEPEPDTRPTEDVATYSATATSRDASHRPASSRGVQPFRFKPLHGRASEGVPLSD